jgi:amino acid adenylation domain-containing protein/non-ribosomal peptide synthase protein (TIGR01720 family)
MQENLLQGFRLSPQQSHLWSLLRGNQAGPFHARCAVLVEGTLNVDLLKTALGEIVNRHEILHTTFQRFSENALPVQVVGDAAVKQIGDYDLRGLTSGQQQARLAELLQATVNFDYERGPLVHALLVTLSADRHVLILNLPALCSDAAGLSILVGELCRCYATLRSGDESGDEPMQYVDLSEWQNELLEQKETEAGRAYWREKDYSNLNSLRLPFRHDESGGEFKPICDRLAVEPQTYARLAALAEKFAVAPQVVLLACWQVLLWRLSNQPHLIVGTCYDGRKYEDLRDALGLFAKYLPVEANLNANLRFNQLVRQLEELTLAAYKRQEYFSWEQVMAADSGEAVDFFPFGFDYAGESPACSAPGLKFSIFEQQVYAEQFEIRLSCVTTAEGLTTELHYDADLYRTQNIRLVHTLLHRVLAGAASRGDDEIGRLLSLSAEEQMQLSLATAPAHAASTPDGLYTRHAARRDTKANAKGRERQELQRVSRDRELPLSFSQQRLWFINQLEPESAAYNLPTVVRLSGHLQVDGLERTVNEIVSRHEVLRTTFAQEGGRPVQVVAPAQPQSIELIDLSALADNEREVQARTLISEEARRPFDLSRGPLLRVRLLQLRRDEYILMLTMHHIVSDGWSMGLLVREVTALYEAFVEGRPSPLGSLPIQYADFAVWQREWLQGEALDEQLDYWKRQLANAPQLLELPTDRPRPAVQSYRGARVPVSVSKPVAAELKKLSQREGATLFMTLLAAFQTLLYRYSGQTDIVVGTPVANRDHLQLEGLIGFFVNTLVLRTSLSGEPSFRQLLKRVREVTLGAYTHQDAPFETLVEMLQPARSLSHTPLFQVTFALESAGPAGASVSVPGLKLSPIESNIAIAKFDLALILNETGQGVTGALEYNRDLFEGSTLELMAGEFEVLLQGIVKSPGERITRLPLLGSRELRRTLVEWNDTRVVYSEESGEFCLHTLFEAQVERTPEAVAVICEQEQVSYHELNVRADELARRLRAVGVGPEVAVGLCAERSIELVVGLLGILKAGAAYVPLDPALPGERLAFMLEDAGIKVLLTQRQLSNSLSSSGAQVLFLEDEPEAAGDEAAPDIKSGVTADNLAYVIYTSGSTGKPKGVMNTHRAISNCLLWMCRQFPLQPTDRVLQKTPFSFDASIWEFFLPLFTGAQLVIARPGGHKDSAYLVEAIREHEVTILQLVPSMLRTLLNEEGIEECRSLKHVLCGGETMFVEDCELFHAKLRANLYNQYGPTEASVDATCWTCAEGTGLSVVPIGQPIANMRLYILDENLQPVPPRIPGELYLGGIGLSRGYLARPKLTAENFIPDPFATEPGARLYRTGDLARRLPDGPVEFLERIDNQVKLRGFRVELGEIEAALKAHAAVHNAVVLMKEAAGTQRLEAFVVSSEQEKVTGNELRAWLRERLPEYMVPTVFFLLEDLPVMPSGKIDRRALLALEKADPTIMFVPPRTEVEKELAEIWCGVLGVERIGIHDNFFDLGGHSLLAVQVMSRVRRALHVELRVRTLFESPTIAALAETIAKPSAQKSDDEGVTVIDQPEQDRVRPVSRDRHLPLSFAQERLWVLDRMEAGNIAYNLPTAILMRGHLDVQALEATLNEIIRRHETLRTTFSEVEGEPVQVIAPTLVLKLDVTDLAHLPGAERQAEARRLAAAEAQRPFDLSRGPLVRASLLRMSADEHVALLTLHHIIADGWSMGVLVQEVTQVYGTLSQGAEPELKKLAVQYADYAVWQREWLNEKILDEQAQYWRQQLGGELQALELPADRPRPPLQTYRGGQRSFKLSSEISAKLVEVSRQHGATLFMTLLAAFKTLLHRYSGQTDITIGTPVANRDRVEIEPLIGFFVNTLVLRTDLSGDPRFDELLGRVRETALGAYAHQDLPFERLVSELQPERSLSHTPLFQVSFILQNVPEADLTLPGLTLSQFNVGVAAVQFDMTMSMVETPDGIAGVLEYNTDLFEAATIERTLSHFQTLLDAAANRPDARLSELPLLSAGEERRILFDWNQTRARFEPDVEWCLHKHFERQVERTPDAVAVVFDHLELSYAELNAHANQLAHRLRAEGVGPEVAVGVCAERSVEMVVALLGILKAGGAYVPLDPALPRERLAFMLEDAGIKVLLTQRGLSDVLPASGAAVLFLETELKGVGNEGELGVENTVTADNLAYVIYTSGSTGRPKGAMNTHRAICNRLLWMQEAYQLDSSDRVLQKTPFSFDVSVWEFFWPLMTGARLVLALPGGHQDGEYLARTIEAEQITTLHFVPSMLRVFLEVPDLAGCASVRRVICSGEALPFDLQERFFERLDAELHNLYGPTEAAVDVTAWKCERASARHLVPIGRPIANTEIYLLDRHQQPVPVGIAAELHIGGVCLARGYAGHPELTAERFIPHSYGGVPGERLYRTGDLARYLPDGEIEYLGRLDNQVKLRGFRIELGEVEAALGEHEAVDECAVLVGQTESGEQRLEAYLVVDAAAGQGSTATELRAWLRERLPEYMVPNVFVLLDELPLSANGKLDRRALLQLSAEREQAGVDAAYVAPRDPVEAALAGIWTEILNLKQVGINDNFFDLGGHSLLATRVVSRLREAFEVELPLRRVFETPTIAGIAAKVNGLLRGDALGHVPPPLVAVARRGGSPLSFAQQRLWFLEQLEPGGSAYNLATAVRLKGPLDSQLLELTFNEIVRRHEALRTTFEQVEGRPLQIVHPPTQARLVIEDLSELAEPEREAQARRLAAVEAQRPFDLTRGPLLRTSLLRLAADQHVVLLTMHHIVSDGWSLEVLVREVSALYEAFSKGEASPLVEPAIQYADFAEWQQQWLRGEVLDAELAYWRKRLEGAAPLLELPADHVRPQVQSYRGASESVALPASVAESVKRLSRELGATRFMTLLAAFKILLARYSGQQDIVVGTPVANRTRLEVEDLIGFFVNTLVLRTNLSGDPSFRELLGRIKETTLGAYAHQDVPFEKLVGEMHPERTLGHTPLFQVMFTFQNASQPSLSGREAGGLTMTPLVDESASSKYDLTLSVSELDGGLDALIEYSTDLFERETIQRMLEHFGVLLESIVANPDERLSRLPLLGATERTRLLDSWSRGEQQPLQSLCVHELIEAQVMRAPDALAVVFGEEQLTYGELNRRANQLARHLRRQGVGPEVMVGSCLEQGSDVAVALLAILKAGGVYVPLDPTNPPERLSYIMTDAGAEVLLTQRKSNVAIPGYEGTVVYLDTDWEEIARNPADNLPAAASADNLMYAIYTSGSTGRPKGACISHRVAANHFLSIRDEFGLKPGDRVLQFYSLSFDGSLEQIVPSLLSGASLFLRDRDVWGVDEFVRKVREWKLTVIDLPPAYWHQFISAPAAQLEYEHLRLMVTGGDVMLPESVRLWRSSPLKSLRLVNAYGPTEAAVTSIIFSVPAETRGDAGLEHIPIGRPLKHCTTFILDENGEPTPTGVSGELHIGGPLLARGYLNRPELTAEKFIPDPFSAEPAARLYRTGDRARYRPDGQIEYLGRIDRQVKMRGFRIELGEIEAALKQHEAVEECAVVLREDKPGQQRLVAYVVAPPAAPELWPSVGEYFIYDPLLYYAMTHHERRNRSYKVAFDRLVGGKTVLDVGTGGDAILARFCIEAGASHVYAIEQLDDAYNHARDLIKELKLDDRITLLHGDATEIELPEKVDVCVSELLGGIASSEGVVGVLNEARRFLRDDGLMIPQRATTRVAAVSLPKELSARPRFSDIAGPYVEKIFETVGHPFDVRVCIRNFPASQLASDAGVFEDLDFSGPIPTELHSTVKLKVNRNTSIDGFLLWLNLQTVEHELIDVLADEYNRLPVFFPVFYPGLEVSEGDNIEGVCSVISSAEQLTPDYRIRGAVLRANGERIDFDYHSPHHSASFRDDAFYKLLFDAGVTNTESTAAREISAGDVSARQVPTPLQTPREFLQARLPEYMVPMAFVALKELPLTPSGKVDWRALPAPGDLRPDAAEQHVAPHTDEEKLLANIWSQVLGLERIGVNDNFFRLGGDSILSIQIIAKANQAGLRLTPRQLFQHQTIAQLAAVAGTVEAVQSEQGEVTGVAPLTPIQRWFFEQHTDDPQHFNQAVMLEVRPGVDAELLQRVMQRLLVQHDAMRLRFERHETDWRQAHVAADDPVSFTRLDFSLLPEDEKRAAIEAAAAEVQRGLDLSHGPLVCAVMFDLGEGRPGRLLLVIHHLLIDGVSWRILLEDLHLGYEQALRGEAISFASKTTSFKHYAERLSEYAESPALRREASYWSGVDYSLAGKLPLDLHEAGNTVASASTVAAALDVEETRALLQEVSQAYRTEINDVLLAALVEAYAAWTGQRALLVELEGHGREEIFEDVDVSRTVGWFTTTFPVLLNVSEAQGTGEVVQEVKEQLRRVPQRGIGYGALRYLIADEELRTRLQSLPQPEVLFNYFGQLDQILAESPLFKPAAESSGALQSGAHERSHLLEINCSVAGGRLQIALTYSEHKHRRATIERFAAQFVAALRSVIAHCRSVEGSYTPSDFPLARLTKQQLQRLLEADRHIEDIYPLSPVQQGMFFHSLYAGEAVYVEQTSGELRGKFDAAALEEAWRRVVGRHQILRAAFHLEDFDEPLQVVREQAALSFVQRDIRKLPKTWQREWLSRYLENDRQRGFDLAVPPLMRVALIRTSEDTHQFVWTFHHLLLDGWSVSLLFKEVLTSYAALARGGDATQEITRPFGDYIAWLAGQDLSAAESFWRAALKGFTRATPLGLDRAARDQGDGEHAGFGETRLSLSADTTEALQSVARQYQLTLNTIVQGAWALVLSHYCGDEDILFGTTVSGRPAELAHVETMIGMFINTLPLRARLEPGETLVSWLGRLQAQQAEMRQYEYTPLAQVQGWSELPPGASMFESLLIFENYPVQTVAEEQRSNLEISNLEERTRTKYRLTVLAATGSEIGLNIAYDRRWFDAAAVGHLLGHLELMLEQIARNSGQRLADLPDWTEAERRQLFGTPATGVDPAARDERPATLPRTQTEELLASIWAEVMGVSQVDVESNFFELGGHSLLATQLVARVRKVFQIEVALRTLFDEPTLAGLALHIDQLLRSGQTLEVPPLAPAPRDAPLPLSFAQQRLWIIQQLSAESAAYNVPIAVRLSGTLAVRALDQTLTEIVRRHEVLRTVFASVQGEPVQVITPARPMRLPVVDLRDLPAEVRERAAQQLTNEEAARPFDLAGGQMLRTMLLRLDEDEHILLFTMHHIVCDGWSTDVLIRETVALYEAFLRGEASPLAELPIQYADYSVWQRAWLQGEVLDEHLAFWKQQLSGLTQLNLPTDFPRPAAPSFRAGVQLFHLPKDVTEALKALTRREECTLFMTLLAAFQTLLYRNSGQADIVVGTDLASRTQAELEQLIGFFVNMLAMRTSFSGNPTFRELLARVRRMTLEAYAHQDLPFEKLVAALQLERDRSRFPVFQAVLVLQNEPSQALLKLPGLVLSTVENEAQTVKFDLILFVAEGDDGLHGHLDYSTDLFKPETMSRLMAQFETLLRSVVADPEARVDELEMSTSKERERQVMQDQERQSAERKKLLSVRRKAVNLAEVTPVRTSFLSDGMELPLVVEPNVRQVDLAHWGNANRDAVEAMVLKHGAVLFRGFDVRSIIDFQNFAQSVGTELFGEYGDLPRAGIGGKVYDSTPYPSDQAILFHNESSHMHRWPLRIWFYCVQAAEQGGETPIVDCREVYRRLDPAIIRLFRRRKVMYVRNYTDGVDVSWRAFYRTEDRGAVEESCRGAGVEFEWKGDNGLRTRQVCEAVRVHPQTGEMVFFNQIQLHHVSFLEPSARRAMMTLFEEKDYPRNVYYGDGAPIEPEVIDAISQTYEQTAVSFPWQPRDILMLDNMLTAHARRPYVGPRKIAVAMGEMFYGERAEGQTAGLTS